MIALARADARRFRLVARRCFPSGRPRGPAPPVRVTTAADTVTLTAHLGEVVVALSTAGSPDGAGTMMLNLAAFDAFEGPGQGTIILEPGPKGAVKARWEGGSASGGATFDPVEFDTVWPEEPEGLDPMPIALLNAMHEAGRTTARDTGKYATTRVQLKASTGQVIATDGKQALVQSGFTFPFDQDLLVPAIPVFGTKELDAQSKIGIAVIGDWVCVAAGPWRVWLLVDKEARFPDVAGAVPRATGSRVDFAESDVEALLAALPKLPGADSEFRPVTLDLGPRVVVRAQDNGGSAIAQVPLPDSIATGPPVRVNLCRDYLGRALALGFRAIQVHSPERPITARTRDRLYLAATLDPAGVVGPDSSPASPVPPRSSPVASRETSPPPPDRNGHADRNGHSEPPPNGDLTDPLAEAEALRSILADAAARATRLVATLKQFKRERKALASAFTSLKQLNLGG